MKAIDKVVNTVVNILDNTQHDKFSWANYNDEFERMKIETVDELKEALISRGVGRLALKYIDNHSNKAKYYEEIIDVEFLSGFQLDWLSTFEWGQQKYIEIIGLDKRIQFGMTA